MNVFEHLQEDKQAVLLTYFNDKEQESLDELSEAQIAGTVACEDADGNIAIQHADYGYLSSDTTCADILDGDGQ